MARTEKAEEILQQSHKEIEQKVNSEEFQNLIREKNKRVLFDLEEFVNSIVKQIETSGLSTNEIEGIRSEVRTIENETRQAILDLLNSEQSPEPSSQPCELITQDDLDALFAGFEKPKEEDAEKQNKESLRQKLQALAEEEMVKIKLEGVWFDKSFNDVAESLISQREEAINRFIAKATQLNLSQGEANHLEELKEDIFVEINRKIAEIFSDHLHLQTDILSRSFNSLIEITEIKNEKLDEDFNENKQHINSKTDELLKKFDACTYLDEQEKEDFKRRLIEISEFYQNRLTEIYNEKKTETQKPELDPSERPPNEGPDLEQPNIEEPDIFSEIHSFGPRETLYIVRIEDVVDALAKRRAKEKLEQLKHKGFVKKIWIRMSEDGYLKKFEKEEENAIKENRNLMATIQARIRGKSEQEKDRGKEISYEQLDAIIDECKEGLVSTESICHRGINYQLASIFKDYATGKMEESRESFEKRMEEKIIPLLRDSKVANPGDMYTSNLFALAQGYRDHIKNIIEKAQLEFGFNQEENIIKAIGAELSLDIKLANRDRDLESKPKTSLRFYEKLINLTQDIPVLSKFIGNPVAAAFLGSLTGKTVTRMAIGFGVIGAGATGAWAALGTAAVFGGAYAAWRRSKDFKEDRRMDLNRRTLGENKDNEQLGERNKKMGEFAYDQIIAEEAIEKLNGLASPEDAVVLIADLEARLSVSKERKVDLIGVSQESGRKYESNIIPMRDLRGALKDARAKFSITENMLFLDKDERIKELRDEIEDKDRKADTARRISSAWAGASGALIGVVVGATMQEAGHHLFGLHSDKTTAIDALKDWFAHSPTTEPGINTGISLESIKINGVDTNFRLPTGFHLENTDGQINVLDSKGNIAIENFQQLLNPDGTPKNTTFTFDDRVFNLDRTNSEIAGKNISLSPEDYIKNHSDKFHDVHRIMWYDNNTDRPAFEKNELALLWGGNKGAGINNNGDFVFNIKHMSPDGSTHGKFSVDAQSAIKEGKLKIMLSMSEGTQEKVFEVPIDSKGNAIILKDTEIAKIFFKNNEGHAEFLGRFAEVAQNLDTKDGVDQVAVLATHEGSGVPSIDEIIKGDSSTTYKLDEILSEKTMPKRPWEDPLVFPIARRKSLELPSKRRKRNINGNETTPAMSSHNSRQASSETEAQPLTSENPPTSKEEINQETLESKESNAKLISLEDKFNELTEGIDMSSSIVTIESRKRTEIGRWLLNDMNPDSFFEDSPGNRRGEADFDIFTQDKINKLRKISITVLPKSWGKDWLKFIERLGNSEVSENQTKEEISAHRASILFKGATLNMILAGLKMEGKENLFKLIEKYKNLNEKRNAHELPIRMARNVDQDNPEDKGELDELNPKTNLDERIENIKKKDKPSAKEVALLKKLEKEKEAERNRALIESVKKNAKRIEFAVHGKIVREEFKEQSDLDGEMSISLLLTGLGLDHTPKVEFVDQGDKKDNAFNLDTGNKDGLTFEGDTIYFDHHGTFSERDSSATKVVYETLLNLGLIGKENYIKNIVDFVTRVDNCNYPGTVDHAVFDNFDKTLWGLKNGIKFKENHKLTNAIIKNIVKFIKDGRDPYTTRLTEAQIKAFGLEDESAKQKAIIETSNDRFKKLEDDGFIIGEEDGPFGKIIIDVIENERSRQNPDDIKGSSGVLDGIEEAKLHGYNTLIVWDKTKNNFIINADREIDFDIRGKDRKRVGMPVRGMWIVENENRNDDLFNKITLTNVIESITGKKISALGIRGKLREFLNKEPKFK